MKNWNFFEIFWNFLKILGIFPDFWLFLTYQVSYHLPDRKLELNALHSVHRYKSTCHGRSSLQIDLSRTIIATNRLVTDDHPYKWTCHGRSRHGRVTDEAKTCDKKKRKHTWMPIGSVHEIRAFIFNVDEREWHRLHCISFQLLTKLSENVWNREPFFMNKYLMTQFSSIRSSIFSKYFFQNCLKCMSPFS